jgi:hypothetical protein
VTKKIYVLTKHARQQMSRRAIPERWIQSVMKDPQQVVSGHGQKKVYQSEFKQRQKAYLYAGGSE